MSERDLLGMRLVCERLWLVSIVNRYRRGLGARRATGCDRGSCTFRRLITDSYYFLDVRGTVVLFSTGYQNSVVSTITRASYVHRRV